MRSHWRITSVPAFTWPLKHPACHYSQLRQHEQPDIKILLANTQTHAALISARMRCRTPASRLNRFILLRRCANQMNLQAGGTPADSLLVWIGMMFLSWHRTACINKRKLRRRWTWQRDRVVKMDTRLGWTDCQWARERQRYMHWKCAFRDACAGTRVLACIASSLCGCNPVQSLLSGWRQTELSFCVRLSRHLAVYQSLSLSSAFSPSLARS